MGLKENSILVLFELYKSKNSFEDVKELCQRNNISDSAGVFEYLKDEGFITPYGYSRTACITAKGKIFIEESNKMTEKDLILAVIEIMKGGSGGNWPLEEVIKKANNGLKLNHFEEESIREFLHENGLTGHVPEYTYQVHLKPKGYKFTSDQYDEIVHPKKEVTPPKIHIEVHGNNNGNLSGMNNGVQYLSNKPDQIQKNKLTTNLIKAIGTIIIGLIIAFLVFKFGWN